MIPFTSVCLHWTAAQEPQPQSQFPPARQNFITQLFFLMLIWKNILAKIHLLSFLCLRKYLTFTQNTVDGDSRQTLERSHLVPVGLQMKRESYVIHHHLRQHRLKPGPAFQHETHTHIHTVSPLVCLLPFWQSPSNKHKTLYVSSRSNRTSISKIGAADAV